MNGPDHYRVAEKLLDSARELANEKSTGTQGESNEAMSTINTAIAIAQVHATLALAAATTAPTFQWEDEIS